jgi:hypothetical protein
MRQLLSGEWSARQKGSNLQVRKDLLLKFSSMKNLFGRQYGGHLVLNALHVGMHMHFLDNLKRCKEVFGELLRTVAQIRLIEVQL